MKKFFKKKSAGMLSANPIIDKVLSFTRKRLENASKWLEEQTKTWSKLEWKILLVLFCTTVLIVCVSVIRGSLMEPVSVFSPEVHIRPLQHYRPEEMKSNSIVILDNLTRNKKYLDSLRTHDSMQYNVITSANPGLIDSLNQLIDLYQTQLK